MLGVAAVWEERKGLHEFNELYKKLEGKVSMILVGVTERQKSKLSKRIIKKSKNDGTVILALLILKYH